MGRRLKQIFLQKHTEGQQALERCSTALINREMQMQWGMTSHQSEWPSSKNLQIINAGEGVEEREPFCAVGGNVNWCNHNGETVWMFLGKLKIAAIWSSNPTARHISRENHNSKRYTHPSVLCNSIYNSQDMEAAQVSVNKWIDKEDVVCIYTHNGITQP